MTRRKFLKGAVGTAAGVTLGGGETLEEVLLKTPSKWVLPSTHSLDGIDSLV